MGSSFSSSTRSRTKFGERGFRRGDQPVARCGLEQVFLELGQLRHAEHRFIAQHVGRVDFRVAMMLRMQINHELRQRPLKLGKLAFENDKARAR